jgi:phosphate transport system ATP-binding protein
MNPRQLTPRLVVRNLSVHTDRGPLLQGVHLEVPARGVLAIIGPAGSGKTTLLRLLNRTLIRGPALQVEGEILLDGDNLYGARQVLRRIRQRVGHVAPDPVPFPGTVEDNVGYGLALHRVVERTQRDLKIERALKTVGLWSRDRSTLTRWADDLTRGELQLMCIARALALDPVVMLLEHVARSLDPVATRKVERCVRSLAEHRGVLMVTHDLAQAARLSDEVVYLEGGRVIERGPTAEVFTHPRLMQTEDFLAGRTAEEAE